MNLRINATAAIGFGCDSWRGEYVFLQIRLVFSSLENVTTHAGHRFMKNLIAMPRPLFFSNLK